MAYSHPESFPLTELRVCTSYIDYSQSFKNLHKMCKRANLNIYWDTKWHFVHLSFTIKTLTQLSLPCSISIRSLWADRLTSLLQRATPLKLESIHLLTDYFTLTMKFPLTGFICRLTRKKLTVKTIPFPVKKIRSTWNRLNEKVCP